MQLIGCQVDTVWEDKRATFDRVRRLLDVAPPDPGALVVLPEMFSTGFSFDIARIAEGEDRETETFLSETAARLGVFMLGGVVTRGRSQKGRNENVVFDTSGRLICRYAKLFPFTFGGETDHYESGERIEVFRWHEATVAPFVCYDLRFPEVFRCVVRRGVQVFTIIANWPVPREEHWLTLLRARAIENQSYVIGVNRCGADPKLTYSGRSQIIDPRGKVVADAGNKEAVLSTEIDLEALADYRRQFPALEDIRGEFLAE